MSPAFASHSACNDCYARRHPGRDPVRMRGELPGDGPPRDQCCFCGEEHGSGIYVRTATAEAPHCTCE